MRPSEQQRIATRHVRTCCAALMRVRSKREVGTAANAVPVNGESAIGRARNDVMMSQQRYGIVIVAAP